MSVEITTSTPGAEVYYTLDGSEPSADATVYTDPINVSSHGTSITIKAVSQKIGLLTSDVSVGVYAISYDSVAEPTFNITPGTYATDITVELATSTNDATIHYTLDGSEPTNLSPVYYYGSPFDVTGDGTRDTVKCCV
jgi:hypothetical protein